MKDSGTRRVASGCLLPMSKRRDIRRLAMQVLYQIDVTGEADGQSIAEGLDTDHDAQAIRSEAVDFALAAWAQREEEDTKVTAVAADWPTHRQPQVDRAILRLSYHELPSGRAHPRIVIHEAVELAKHYSNENAPSFINGVLDKLHRTLDLPEVVKEPQEESAEGWLEDAVEGEK